MIYFSFNHYKCAQSHDKLVSWLGYGSNWITWLYWLENVRNTKKSTIFATTCHVELCKICGLFFFWTKLRFNNVTSCNKSCELFFFFVDKTKVWYFRYCSLCSSFKIQSFDYLTKKNTLISHKKKFMWQNLKREN